MSMTERYLESLPADEQDAILGGIDNAYISPDEWTNDAENEPDEYNDITDGMYDGRDGETDREWARALIDEDDRECAPLIRPEGKCVRLENADGTIWKL